MWISLLLTVRLVSAQAAAHEIAQLSKEAPKFADNRVEEFNKIATGDQKDTDRFLRDEETKLKQTEKKADKDITKQKAFVKKEDKEISALNNDLVMATAVTEQDWAKEESQAEMDTTDAEDEKDSIKGDTESLAEETISTEEEETEKQIGRIQTTAEKTVDDYVGLGVATKEENSRLRTEISNAAKEQKSYSGEQKGILKELKGGLKETAKGTTGMDKVETKTFAKVKAGNEKAAYATKSSASSAAKATESTIKKKETTFEKEVNAVHKDFSKELKGMQKEEDGIQKELNKNLLIVNNEFNSAQKVSLTEEGMLMKGTEKEMERQMKILEKTEDGIENTASSAQGVVNKNTKENDQLRNDLTKTSKDTEKFLNDKNAAMASAVTGALTSSKKEQFSTIKSSTTKVRSKLDSDQAEMKKSFETAAYKVGEDKRAAETLGADLQKTIKGTTDAAGKSGNMIGSVTKVIEKTKQESDVAIEKADEGIKVELGNIQNKIVDSTATAEDEFGALAQDGLVKAQEELKNAIGQAKQGQLEYVAKSDTLLQNVEKDIKMKQSMIGDSVTKDEATAKSINAASLREKGKVEPISDQLKDAADVINEDLTLVKKQIKEAVVKDTEGTNDITRKFNEDVKESQSKAREGIEEQEEDVRSATEKEFTGLTENFDKLKHTANAAFKESDAEVQKSGTTLLETEQHVAKVTADLQREDAALQQNIISTEEAMQSASKVQPAKLQKELRTITQFENDKLNLAQQDIQKRAQMVIDREHSAVNAIQGQTMANVESRMKDAEIDAQATSTKFDEVKKKIGDLGGMVSTGVQNLDDKKNRFGSAMEQASTKENMLLKAVDEDVKREKDGVEKRSREITDVVMGRITKINEDQLSTLTAMKQSTEGKLDAEKARVTATTDNLGKIVGSKEKLVGTQVSTELEKADANKKAAMQLMHDAEAAGSSLLHGVSQLEIHQQGDQDKVQSTLNKEQSDTTDQMDKETGDLEGLTNRLHHSEEAAETEVKNFDQGVEDELQTKKDQINGAIDAVGRRVKNSLPKGGPDELADEFARDTEAAANELNATESKMEQVSEKEQSQLDAFKHHLNQISVQRTKDVGKVHDEIVEVKKEVADKMEETIDAIGSMRNKSYTAYADFGWQQKTLTRMLKNASQMTSNHDGDEITQMKDKHDVLERDHFRLLDWQAKFKHYTLAWREEVNSKLRILSGEVGEEDNGIAETQLQQEESMASTMSGLKAGVEGEVVSAVGREASKVSNLVGMVNSDLDTVFTKSAKSDEDAGREISEAQNGLDIAKKQSGKEMAEIAEAQEHLTEKAAKYTGAVDTAEAEVSQNLLLPQQSASDKARAQDAKLQWLDTHLAGMSLLETNATTTAREKSAALEHAAVQALVQYRAMLQKETAALESSCTSLESRVEAAERALKDAGVL